MRMTKVNHSQSWLVSSEQSVSATGLNVTMVSLPISCFTPVSFAMDFCVERYTTLGKYNDRVRIGFNLRSG